MRTLLLLTIFALFSGCTAPRCRPYFVFGADEFVCDSYLIRQGKVAILGMEGKCLRPITDEDMQEYTDVIVEDDVMTVMVYHPTRGEEFLQPFKFINEGVGGFRVRNGRLDLPDIGSVEVAGLTLDEAKEKIQEIYRGEIPSVNVFLNYRERLTKKVEFAGLSAAATIPVDGKIRLYETLSRARISTNANLFMSYVLRDGEQLAIDLHRLLNEGDLCQNIVMRGGDKIFIANPSDARVMVMGEVLLPRPVDVPYGYISLREALVTAGGIPFTGDKRNIQVIRGDLECPKIYVLCWEHIIQLPNDSLLLMPGDTVYVSETAITQWNRFLVQLMPTVYSLQAGRAIYTISPGD